MQTKKTLRVGIVVGEHSGDLLGSELIKSLKNENDTDIELFGIGGPKLSELGLKSEFDFKKINVMGLVEPLQNFRELNKLRKKLISLFEDKKIDYFIGVDSPDFNITIHKQLKKKGHIKNIQLVSPSVWVWRQGRLKHIRNFIDMTICLFNFEHEFYQKENLKSIHLGHPFSHLEKGNMQFIYNKYNGKNNGSDQEKRLKSICVYHCFYPTFSSVCKYECYGNSYGRPVWHSKWLKNSKMQNACYKE